MGSLSAHRQNPASPRQPRVRSGGPLQRAHHGPRKSRFLPPSPRRHRSLARESKDPPYGPRHSTQPPLRRRQPSPHRRLRPPRPATLRQPSFSGLAPTELTPPPFKSQ